MSLRVWIGLLLTFAVGAGKAAPAIKVNLEEGAVLGDIVTVTAQVTSDAGISKVEFSIDDQIRLTVMKPPYEYKWDTIDDDEGKHTVIVAAYDTEGKAVTKRTRVETDNGLTLGIKPHYDKAMALFHKGEMEVAALAGRKAYRINQFDLDAIKGMALATSVRGDVNRAIDMVTNPPRQNNQIVGDPTRFPLRDRDGLELRGYFHLKRASSKPNEGSAADLAQAMEVSRKFANTLLAEIKAAHPEPYKSLGDRLTVADSILMAGSYEEALKVYQGANERGASNTRIRNRIALALCRMNRFPEAERVLLDEINSGQADQSTHAALGAMYLSQRRYAKARSEVDAGAQRHSAPCLLVAAQADIMLRDFRHGFEELKEAAAKTDLPEIHYIAAGLRFDSGDLKQATSSILEAMIRNPLNLDAFAQRGFQIAALLPDKGFEQALPVFDAILKQDPKNADARMGRAMALISQKKYRSGGEIALELTKENRFAADAWIVLAAGYAGIDDQTRATEALMTARKLDPEQFNDAIIPKMPAFVARAARYRRSLLISAALLDAGDTEKQTAEVGQE